MTGSEVDLKLSKIQVTRVGGGGGGAMAAYSNRLQCKQ